jgi:HAD superfamily hydrolase (TIGR01509 family)
MIKAIIFDMDGVLIDTVQIGLRVRKKLLARYNINLDVVPDQQGEGHRAASLKLLLASVKSHYGIEIDHGEFAKLSREHMSKELQEYGISADPSLITFLEELKEHNIICAIASSSLREGIDIKLKILGIRQYFSVIVSGSDVKEHKPHPEVYQRVMGELSLQPEDCIIFEDSLTGIEAGRAAGCRVIGFTQYNPPKESLAGVAAVVKSWSEISYDRLRYLLADID